MRFCRHNRSDSANTIQRLRATTRAIATIVLASSVTESLAGTNDYTGASGGNWNIGTNWTLGGGSAHGVPVNGDDAVLGGVGSGAFTVNYNTTYGAPGLNSLTINATAPATFTLNQTTAGTTMYAASEYIGTTIYGNIYNQTNGTNTVSGNIYLGSTGNANSEGNYNLGGGTLNVGGGEFIGLSSETLFGGSSFNQTGGTNNCSVVAVGEGLKGTGAYNFSAGSLNANVILVGAFTGTTNNFTQSGSAAATLSGTGLTIGGGSAIGTFTLNGGSIAVNNSGNVDVGNGTLVQTAGSVTLSGARGLL